MKLQKRVVRGAALSFLAAGTLVGAQVSSTTLLGSTASTNVMKDVVARAKKNRPNVMQELRMYTAFRQKCRDLVGENPEYKCPDYNNRAAVEAFVNGTELSTTATHAAATATGVVILDMQDLSDVDQALMRRYINIRNCPVTLKEHTPGFYALCKRQILKNLSRGERKGVTKKVQERFKSIRDAAEARKAARMELQK